jgi:hypothetical protein
MVAIAQDQDAAAEVFDFVWCECEREEQGKRQTALIYDSRPQSPEPVYWSPTIGPQADAGLENKEV